jgi:hypothetical protein
MLGDFEEIVRYIVDKSSELKNKFTDAKGAPVEFACIFCQNEGEYNELDEAVSSKGRLVQNTPSGKTYLLREAIQTTAGPLRLLKVRKPDPARPERGDADFNTDYQKFKSKYEGKLGFELLKRDNFEMLRLSDDNAGFDVLACFSSIPMSKDLGIELK